MYETNVRRHLELYIFCYICLELLFVRFFQRPCSKFLPHDVWENVPSHFFFVCTLYHSLGIYNLRWFRFQHDELGCGRLNYFCCQKMNNIWHKMALLPSFAWNFIEKIEFIMNFFLEDTIRKRINERKFLQTSLTLYIFPVFLLSCQSSNVKT